jgi:hypothetical protein
VRLTLVGALFIQSWSKQQHWRMTKDSDCDSFYEILLPPFHSTCQGEFFLRVPIVRCLFSHFSVRSSILCTSWRGRRILFRSFFAVSKCRIRRLEHYNRLP